MEKVDAVYEGAYFELKSLEAALNLDKVMSVATWAIFIYIAAHKRRYAADIRMYFGLNQPAVSRHLQRLGRGSPSGSAAVGKGLGLIDWSEDYRDSRVRVYHLTDKGRELAKDVLTYI